MLLLYIYPLENLLDEEIIPVLSRDLYITLNREYFNACFFVLSSKCGDLIWMTISLKDQ